MRRLRLQSSFRRAWDLSDAFGGRRAGSNAEPRRSCRCRIRRHPCRPRPRAGCGRAFAARRAAAGQLADGRLRGAHGRRPGRGDDFASEPADCGWTPGHTARTRHRCPHLHRCAGAAWCRCHRHAGTRSRAGRPRHAAGSAPPWRLDPARRPRRRSGRCGRWCRDAPGCAACRPDRCSRRRACHGAPAIARRGVLHRRRAGHAG